MTAEVTRITPLTSETTTVGQRVIILSEDERYGGVWTVVKKNPKSVDVEQPGQRLLRAGYWDLAAATPEQIAAADAKPAAVRFTLGEVVKVNPDLLKQPNFAKFAGQYLVVLQDNGGDNKVKAAKLGGDGDRFMRFGRRALVSATVSVSES